MNSIDVDQNVEDLKIRVFEKLQEVKKELETKLKIIIPDLPIRFDLRGGYCAGKFIFIYSRRGKAISEEASHISFNLKLLKGFTDDFIKNVVPHEYCHYVSFIIAKAAGVSFKKFKPHGIEWKSLMVSLGLEPSVCHTYVLPGDLKKKIRYKYSCNCGKFSMVSGVIHSRIQNINEYNGAFILVTKSKNKKTKKALQYMCTGCGSKITKNTLFEKVFLEVSRASPVHQ